MTERQYNWGFLLLGAFIGVSFMGAYWATMPVFAAPFPPALPRPLAIAVPETNRFTATVAWDASPDPRAIGYELAWGISSGEYTNVRRAFTSTLLTLSNLPPARYYFAARCYDAAGQTSVFSSEITFILPAPQTNYVTAWVESATNLVGPWQTVWSVTRTNPPDRRFYWLKIREANTP